jgi:uncharacterized protein (DUF1330 family)
MVKLKAILTPKVRAAEASQRVGGSPGQQCRADRAGRSSVKAIALALRARLCNDFGDTEFHDCAVRPLSCNPEGENNVNRYITVGLAMIAGAVLGAAIVQTLHAQTKPPAYNIAEITIKDQDGYNKEYLPLITKVLTDAGGKFLIRGGKTISYEGGAPAPRVVVIQFESLDKLQTLYNSAPYKDAIAVGDKYATQRIFGAEGVSP